MIVWTDGDEVACFVAEFSRWPVEFGECRSMAVLSPEGEALAGFVFHDWNPHAETIELSGASVSPRWCSRAVLREMAGYAFSFAQMLVVRTDPDNPCIRPFLRVGGQLHIIPRMRGRNADEAIVTLTAEAWATSRFAK